MGPTTRGAGAGGGAELLAEAGAVAVSDGLVARAAREGERLHRRALRGLRDGC